MRLANNFDNFISYDNVAMEAKLKCDYGNKLFIISYTGSPVRRHYCA